MVHCCCQSRRGRNGLTSSGNELVSRSGVMMTLWTRNLSRHLAPGAGSSFIGWRSTGAEGQLCRVAVFSPWRNACPPSSAPPCTGSTWHGECSRGRRRDSRPLMKSSPRSRTCHSQAWPTLPWPVCCRSQAASSSGLRGLRDESSARGTHPAPARSPRARYGPSWGARSTVWARSS